jgi:membrane protease subunit (stomatin/prohibitin family)
VIVRDPDLGPVRIRAFGTYSLRAVDARKLLVELVGTDSVFEADEISEWLRSMINSAFADVIADAGVGVLDFASHYGDLSEALRGEVQNRIDDEYGLELPKLNIVNISLPAEVEKAVDARSSMAIVGDLAQYQAFQIATATPDAAKNPAGGIAGAGMGLGMGMAMAGPMLGGALSAPQSAPQTAPPMPMRMWHVAQNGEATGPFGEPQLIDSIRAGSVRRDNLVWSAGMASWIEAGQVPALSEHFPAVPPPLP